MLWLCPSVCLDLLLWVNYNWTGYHLTFKFLLFELFHWLWEQLLNIFSSICAVLQLLISIEKIIYHTYGFYYPVSDFMSNLIRINRFLSFNCSSTKSKEYRDRQRSTEIEIQLLSLHFQFWTIYSSLIRSNNPVPIDF